MVLRQDQEDRGREERRPFEADLPEGPFGQVEPGTDGRHRRRHSLSRNAERLEVDESI